MGTILLKATEQPAIEAIPIVLQKIIVSWPQAILGTVVDHYTNLKYDYTYRPPDKRLSHVTGGPVAGALRPGEKTLWCGQPSRKLLVFRKSDLATIPFALFWTAFSIFWTLAALFAVLESSPVVLAFDICFPLFGIPFVAIGIYLLAGRFVMDFIVRRHTWYALTDRRAIALVVHRGQNSASVSLLELDRVDVDMHRDGRGTLTFHGKTVHDGDGGRAFYVTDILGGNDTLTFEHIEDPKHVYDMVLEAQEEVWARKTVEKATSGKG